ncbi:26S proteasome non-ATPase regulatory subunit 5 [Globomyces pollinis-pini]|nr:26S proteasome non-ATPase regulatory subunit 5 [Globomyces pollinis-pini]
MTKHSELNSAISYILNYDPSQPDQSENIATLVNSLNIILTALSLNVPLNLETVNSTDNNTWNSKIIQLLFLFHSDQSIVSSATSILSFTISTLSQSDLDSILLSLTSENLILKQFAVDLLFKHISNPSVNQVDNHELIFLQLINSLSSSNLKLATSTQALLQIIPTKINDLKLFFKLVSDPLLELTTNKNEVVSVRAFELITDWCCLSDAVFEECLHSGLLVFITDFATSKHDILSALNVIEIFIKLSNNANCFALMSKTKLLNDLAEIISKYSDYDSLIVSFAIKFWGFFIFNNPDKFHLIQADFRILESFDVLLESEDSDLQKAVVIAIGNLGSTVVGFQYLCQQKFLLNTFTQFLRTAAGDDKVCSLRTLSCLLGNAPDCSLESITLFHQISATPLDWLIHLAKSSIEEIAIGALATIKNVMSFKFGIQSILQSNQFSFLLERRKETTTIIKEWKYSIVQTISLNVDAKDVLGDVIYKRFWIFAKEGPFKTEYEPTVALANAS